MGSRILVAPLAIFILAILAGATACSGALTSSITPITATPPSPQRQPTAGSTFTPATAPAASSSACRSTPLANVYHPDRLKVMNPCMSISGTVMSVRHEDDGDYHINVKLDPPFADLTNDKNVSGEHGNLVTEIVPADETGCTVGQPPKPATGTYDYGICTGADLAPPSVGMHVAMTGPYVLDQVHGWMEIHPVWKWQVSTGVAATATSTITATAATTTKLSETAIPTGAAGKCDDGTYTFSQPHSGACSGHGGVAAWY